MPQGAEKREDLRGPVVVHPTTTRHPETEPKPCSTQRAAGTGRRTPEERRSREGQGCRTPRRLRPRAAWHHGHSRRTPRPKKCQPWQSPTSPIRPETSSNTRSTPYPPRPRRPFPRGATDTMGYKAPWGTKAPPRPSARLDLWAMLLREKSDGEDAGDPPAVMSWTRHCPASK